MVQAVRSNEQARQEYQWVSGHIMDARRAGFQQGITQGVAQGMRQGEARGSRQAKLETARLMKAETLASDLIAKVTGLSKEEIEKL